MIDSSNSTPSPSSPGVSRRRLVRAGLTAAPVMAALKSNSVLAGDHTCIRPSSFSSLTAAKMKVSQGRTFKTDYECKSYGAWKNSNTGLPKGFKKHQFLSNATGFTVNPGNDYSGLTIQDVLERSSGQDIALARHVAAAFLTATAYSNQQSRVLLTTGQCQAIWNGRGVWSPFAGANWTKAQTIAYLDMVYGSAFL